MKCRNFNFSRFQLSRIILQAKHNEPNTKNYKLHFNTRFMESRKTRDFDNQVIFTDQCIGKN